MNTQEKTVLEIMKKHNLEENIALKEEIQQEILKNCKIEVENQLETQKKWVETMMNVKIAGSAKFKEIEEKFQKFQEKSAESQEKIVGTQAYIVQKIAALGTGMNVRMSVCKNLMAGVSEKASATEVARVKSEIERIGEKMMETVQEKAQTEGVVKEKLVNVEKNLEEMRKKSGVWGH